MKFQKNKTLEERINELSNECQNYVVAYAEEKKKGTGLPVQTVIQMLNRGTAIQTALHIMAIQRRDEEIVRKQDAPERQSA